MSEQRMQATGGCRCDTNPVRYEYNRAPFEVHYCLCTDCTDISGGAMALIAVVERDAFRITQGEEKKEMACLKAGLPTSKLPGKLHTPLFLRLLRKPSL
jgi:hypothetical protein